MIFFLGLFTIYTIVKYILAMQYKADCRKKMKANQKMQEKLMLKLGSEEA